MRSNLTRSRTFDPEEADYFYMPIYTSCFIYPIHCWADGPWWHSPSGPRVMHVANMLLEARDWVRSHFPWWNRRGGRDHIFLMTHDEGACYAPIEIFNSSIFLTHWGRLDLHHRSNTAFTPDNYTQEYVYSNQPNGWLKTIQGHPCYDPVK
ncbi:EGF-like domain-containing protein, partial [Haematococcus lacustris]